MKKENYKMKTISIVYKSNKDLELFLFWSAEINFIYSKNNRCLRQSNRHAVFQTIFYINRVIEVL